MYAACRDAMAELGSRLVPTRLALAVPTRCPSCAKFGNIVLEQTIKAGIVTFEWCCRACDAAWPVTANEPPPLTDNVIELRTKPDRRKTTRNDRRN